MTTFGEEMELTTTDREIYTLLFRDIDKPDRVSSLWLMKNLLTPIAYWKMFRDTWEGSENLFADDYLFESMFSYQQQWHGLFMSVGERAKLRTIGPEIFVYRGTSPINMEGWSWTLNKDIVEFFAKRAATDGVGSIYSEAILKSNELHKGKW